MARGRPLHRLALKGGLLFGLMALRINAWAQPLLHPWSGKGTRARKTLSRGAGYGDVLLRFGLLNRGLSSSGPISDGDGVEVMLRHRPDGSCYLLGVNRRDQTVTVLKRVRGQESVLLHSAYEAPVGRWQAVDAAARNNADGSVSLELVVDGRLLASALDTGAAGGPPLREAGQVGLAGRNDDFEVRGVAVVTPSPEAAAPAPALILPAPGSRVAGPIVVQAKTAGPSLAGIRFLVDGRPLAAEDLAAPYSAVWDTAGSANGAHVVSAVARDVQGRITTLPGTVLIVANDERGAQAADVAVESLDGGKAVVRWRSDEPAMAQVEYGRTDSYGLETPLVLQVKTDHTAVLTGLVPGSEYHYRLRLRDEAGNVTLSGDLSLSTPPDSASPAAMPVSGGDGAAAVVYDSPEAAAAAGSTLFAGSMGGDGSAFTGGAAPSAAPDDARAREKFLTPAMADGINDSASFGAGAAEVTIFNVRGRKIFQASRGAAAVLTWNGRDDSGAVVESGVYIAKIRKDDQAFVYQAFAVAK